VKLKTRIGFVLVAVMAALLTGSGLIATSGTPRDATAAPTFVPFPCADRNWTMGDSRFTALAGAKAYFGQYAGGLYRMEIPEKWNGELVLYAHGYAGEGELLNVSGPTGGWRSSLIEQGYAWAASSYRCNGYVPGIGLQDTMLLTPLFLEINGKAPSRTYLTGHSMGGHITVLGMQEFPKAFDGALAMCPAGPGLFDYFTAMGAAAEVVTGLKFSGAEPAAATLAKMLAITGTPPNLTAKGRQMASIEILSSGGARPFAGEGVSVYFAIGISGAKMSGASDFRTAAMTNESWVYGIDNGLGVNADELNAAVRRLAPNVENRGENTKYNEVKPFTGKIDKPMITMHDTGDLFVPIFLERQLHAAATKAGTTNMLTQRIYRTGQHCGYNAQETITSFNDMVAWSKGGPKATGDDVNASLGDAGKQFTSPLRPGDPGTRSITPGVFAPLPPNTGTGILAQDGGGTGRQTPVALAAIILAAVLGSAMSWRRERPR
jgi:pimeloyl-ACP methyl ester carboxylesterase